MNPFNLPIEKLSELDKLNEELGQACLNLEANSHLESSDLPAHALPRPGLGKLALEPVIKNATFSLLQQASILVKRAQKQALEVLQQTHLEALAMQEKAAQLGAFQKSELARKVRDETRDAAVTEALQWLIDEQQMERTIMYSLEARVRENMAAVLEEWFAEQDQMAQLASRLATLVQQRVQQQACKLRLHPDACEAVKAQLEQLVDSANLSYIDYLADTMLEPEQAVLETEFLRIEFDLARHRSAVIAALREMTVEETVEDV